MSMAMIVRLLYRPRINWLVRTLLRPFSAILPEVARIPACGTIKVRLPEGQKILLAANPTSHLSKLLFWKGFRGFEYERKGDSDLSLVTGLYASVFFDLRRR